MLRALQSMQIGTSHRYDDYRQKYFFYVINTRNSCKDNPGQNLVGGGGGYRLASLHVCCIKILAVSGELCLPS